MEAVKELCPVCSEEEITIYDDMCEDCEGKMNYSRETFMWDNISRYLKCK